MFHLKPQIIEGIETQGFIETLVVVAVTAFDFPVVSGCSGPYELMMDSQFIQTAVEGVDLLSRLGLGKLEAVVGLDDVGLVSVVSDSPSDEVGAVGFTVFVVRVEVTFPGGFFNHGVLEERRIFR